MMKITGSENQKKWQVISDFGSEALDLASPSGETEAGSPFARVDRGDGEPAAIPGPVEVKMSHPICKCDHAEIFDGEARSRTGNLEESIAMARRNGKARKSEKSDTKSSKPDFFCRVHDGFRIAARKTSAVLGTPWAFMTAVGVIVVWALSGHIFGYSDTWQLIINTGTTIVTFLMVFLIQNTQNRDSKAIQLKLDELIRSLDGARNRLMDLETLSDEDLEKFQKDFERLRKRSEDTAEKVETISREGKSA
jgi:low affinity Fe/Cu permease